MSRARARRLGWLLGLLLHAPGTAAGGVETLVIPDVPYLAQTEALCGGAALAMVLRYWGHDAVRPEDFAGELDAEGTGIATQALTAAARRSASAFVFRGGAGAVVAHLGKGRPIIALAEVAPGRYHYVVLLAWHNGRLLLHDPATGPFRVMSEAAWLDAWDATGNWALLVVTDATRAPVAREAAADAPLREAGSCAAWVRAAIDDARAGRVDAARQQLEAAAAWCPASSRPLRELAALEFRDEAWTAAAALAAEAVARDPQDAHAWRLLATSRFLAGQPVAALAAWNRVAEPRFDTLHTSGLERTPVRTLAAYLDIEADSVLTPASLRRARRRVAALPALHAARVGYRPMPGGRAQVEAAVVERPALSSLRWVLLDAVVRGARERALGVRVQGLTSQGEALRAFGRWQPERSHAALAASAPRALGLPGVVSLEASWDEQSYRPLAGGAAPERERRRRVSLAVGDWRGADLRVSATLALDQWRQRGRYASFSGALEQRLASDRLALMATGAGWWSASAAPFYALSAQARARATTGDGPNVFADLTYDVASQRAPRALWQGAGSGAARERVLRGHSVLLEGLVGGPSFGRELVCASLEADAGLGSLGPLTLRGAAYVDLARVLAPARGAMLVDVGAGLSLRVPGSRSSLRMNLAAPWGDWRFRLSVGWRAEWPAASDPTGS